MKFNKCKVIYIALSALIFLSQSVSSNDTLLSLNTLQNNGAKLDSIFINTIDGTLYAISKTDGKIQWSLKEDYVLKVPNEHKKPYFLTDPRDGSLYVFNPRDGIKKFPYTIAELVVASPFRSGDGQFYTGDKRDQWIAVDARTGLKLDSLTSINQSSKISTNSHQQVLYLPRTQYTISMFDSYGNRKFNISYHDYQSQAEGQPSTPEYPYYHLTSSSDGLLITIDKKSGKIAWQIRLTHPVVNIYEYKSEHLYKIPFAVFSLEALTSLAHESWRYKDMFSSNKELTTRSIFTPTLYIGYFDCCNFYALTAFVSNSDIKLIDSQPSNAIPSNDNQPTDNTQSNSNNVEIGHHKIPEPYEIQMDGKNNIGKEGDSPNDGFKFLFYQTPQCPASPSKKPKTGFKDFLMHSKYVWSVCAIFATMVFIRVYNKIRAKPTEISSNNFPSNSSKNSISNESNKSTNNSSVANSVPTPIMNDEGFFRIGKILYDPKSVLGRGCEGTCVYKGWFEERPVAVKRLLPDCYTLADREVELLRHADQHANVIRYFCTESDTQFRYIALELCQATLQEYVSRNHEFVDKIKPLSLLYQATNGLAHLHNLDIVHRDIKPHNVLISVPNNRGEVIAMISDFGLCKRLDMGNASFSKRSGITGTDGWIAPELMESSPPDRRITKAIDVFSLGCVYYYVLTLGSHPFGDSFRRQMNILTNSFKLDKLAGVNCDSYMQRVLIEKMIGADATNRPTAPELLSHPVFWSKTKTLQFLQDVSDRIEKIDNDDPIVLNLEKNANITLKNNWKTHISVELQEDLKKFRSYNGVSVRDLLRAIRNKKHHYRELSDTVKNSLGELPDGFVEYFTSRFPKLILHTYEAMRPCKNEPMLDVYYDHELRNNF